MLYELLEKLAQMFPNREIIGGDNRTFIQWQNIIQDITSPGWAFYARISDGDGWHVRHYTSLRDLMFDYHADLRMEECEFFAANGCGFPSFPGERERLEKLGRLIYLGHVDPFACKFDGIVRVLFS